MQNEPVKNTGESPQYKKQRHGCLTVWLWLIIIFNILGVILTAAGTTATDKLNLPAWYIPVAIIATVFVVVFAIALLKWKAWGFWGLVAMEGLSALASIAESGNYYAIISAVIGVVILVLLLNMGGENKAWNQLE
jgi:hypothetical protein